MNSLPARLLMLVSVVMIPALGFLTYSESKASRVRQHLMEDEALRLVQLVSSEQQRIFEAAEQVLTAISGAPVLEDNIPGLCQRLLANLHRQSPRYDFVGVLGLDGHLVCAPGPFDRSLDMSDRAFFRLALQTGGFVIGDYTEGRSSKEPTIHMARPFRNQDGVVTGVVEIALSLKWLGQQLEHLTLPPGAAVAIMDRNGTTLARSPDGERYVGQPMPADNRYLLDGNEIQVVALTARDGRPRIVGYSPLGADPKGLLIAVGLDRDVDFDDAERASRTGLMLIVAGAGSALAITVLLGASLIRRPFNRLLIVADRWRTGDLAARTGMREDNSEFGRLAGAFDRMAVVQEARERSLRESEERFRGTFEQAAVGMSHLSLDGAWLQVNDKLCEITGYSRDEMLGHTFREITHPDDLQADLAQRAAVLAGEIATFTIEKRYLRTDGSIVWINVTVSLLSDAYGKPGSFIAVVEDITSRRRAEEALRQMNATLEERVNQEVTARKEAQERAAHGERMQALGQLAGGIAHDFNNVLQAVSGAASLIERRPANETGVRRLARIVLEASDRGASITRRMLAFGRRADLRAEALDAAALLGDLREILVHTLGTAIEVQVRSEPGLPLLLADRGQLETVLVNLATNARDAMPNGGRLILSAEADVVSADDPAHPAVLAPGHYVRLSVADTGVGMDAATLARAAEPFFTTKGIGIGTGLGLSIAKGFAEQSGGALGLDSSPGKGATIALWLPEAVSAEPPTTATPQVAANAAVATSSKSTALAQVLVVDDEDLVREMLAETLEHAGYGVLTARNGNEALALLAAGEAVDVLVTDLSMPGRDGLAVIREAQKHHPNLAALLLTGYAGEGATLAVGGIVSGSFSLLRKPVRAAHLIDRVQTLLEGRPKARLGHSATLADLGHF